jgi:hypothetical protein
MTLKALALLSIGLSVSGCAVDKQLAATGGSKADGVVDLSFEIGEFQTAKIDWAKA